MQDYAEDFSNKISSVDKVTQRIIKEQRGSLGGTVRPFTKIMVCKDPAMLYKFYKIQVLCSLLNTRLDDKTVVAKLKVKNLK